MTLGDWSANMCCSILMLLGGVIGFSIGMKEVKKKHYAPVWGLIIGAIIGLCVFFLWILAGPLIGNIIAP
jgi:hypothetical protein